MSTVSILLRCKRLAGAARVMIRLLDVTTQSSNMLSTSAGAVEDTLQLICDLLPWFWCHWRVVPAGREDAAEGVEAAALGAVAGQLTAAREGLRPVGPDVLEAAAARLNVGLDDATTSSGRSSGSLSTSHCTCTALARALVGIVTVESRRLCGATPRMRTVSPFWSSKEVSVIAVSGRAGGGEVVEGLTTAESAALARRTAALAFAPQSLAATEQRVRALARHGSWSKGDKWMAVQSVSRCRLGLGVTLAVLGRSCSKWNVSVLQSKLQTRSCLCC